MRGREGQQGRHSGLRTQDPGPRTQHSALRPRSSLIVNADDFGISEGVNRGIVETHRHGIVTSATVMANMPALDHAARLARENPDLGVGLHLVLTEGMPILPSSRVRSLVDGGGRFLPFGRLMVGLSVGRINLGEVEAELGAQAERALSAGLTLTHLDSHHHVHLHPRLQRVAVGLAVRHGLRGIRCPAELGAGDVVRKAGMLLDGPLLGEVRGEGRAQHSALRAQHSREGRGEEPRRRYLKAAVLSLLGWQLRGRARRAGLSAPDHFRGLLLGWAFSRDELLALLRRLPTGCTELMCHPGYPDQALGRRTSYSSGRDREMEALLDPSAPGLLAGAGVRLANYSGLSR